MSKEPRGAQQQQQAGGERKYVTAQNFHLLQSRVKPLPPTADTSKLPNGGATTTLFQLKEHVEFRCAHCKRDKIRDDALALDTQTGRITCQKCFARLIRPRTYKPTRLVPFPSLLSWLNFGGADQQNAENAFEKKDMNFRMAEAVIPSEARGKNTYNEDGSDGSLTGLITYSATPLQGLAAQQQNQLQQQSQQQYHQNSSADAAMSATNSSSAFSKEHPCIAVFGFKSTNSCTHGPTCFFNRAPGDLCLAYLMGLCFDSQKCGRVHKKVFDLPPQETHPDRWEIVTVPRSQKDVNDDDANDEDEEVARETPAFRDWVVRKKNSGNQAEWQLWNQKSGDSVDAPIRALLDEFLPAPKIEPKPKKKAVVTATTTTTAPQLNASVIGNLLKQMKK